MQDFSKRHSQSSFLIRFALRFVGVLALVLVALVAVRASYNMYGKFAQAADAGKNAEARLAMLIEQKSQVGAAVESFDSPRGVEAEVRQRYGVARPGEGRIEIVRDAASSSALHKNQSSNIFVRMFEALWPF
ncbi:MAG: hypothetical protein AAB449_02640 [Patescibacteria group bacterium]